MILFIGYGNTLRRDDGAGREFVSRIAARFPQNMVRVLECHQLMPELALDIASPDITAVYFVDASVATMQGRIRTIERTSLPPSTGHHLTPSLLLDLSYVLYQVAVPAWLIEIPAFDLDCGEGLSAPCELEMSTVVQNVTEYLEFANVP